MVKITVTKAAKLAIEEYCRRERSSSLAASHEDEARLDSLGGLDVGSPIDHVELARISKSLVTSQAPGLGQSDESHTAWRLDRLLRGTTVARQTTPPAAKPQQTAEYKALMQKLRADEGKRQYERMTRSVAAPETFGQRFPNAPGHDFNPAISHGQTGNDEEDDMTFQDVNRQMILIINVLISIICCSVFIWVAARRWSVPQRLGLSMSGSGVVAFAEVAIYLGYIKRLGDAKQKEKKALEKKEVVETWVIDRRQQNAGLRLTTVDLMPTKGHTAMTTKDFHHPFVPYDIQVRFMTELYECIEEGGVGIFESPTGTGKSLSLICSSLTWLREHRRRLFDEAFATVEVDDDDPDWMAEHAKASRRREMRQMREDFEARLNVAREKERKVRERAAYGNSANKRRKVTSDQPHATSDDDDGFLLDDYESDSDRHKTPVQVSEYSVETSKLMKQLGIVHHARQEGELGEDVDELKIYFCSRTHSQLSQFVRELHRVRLPPGMPPEPDRSCEESLKHVPLGSRRNLCINPKVVKLQSQTAVNERCVELQQSSTPADQKCPFLPKQDSGDLVLDFRDHALAEIRDIEDMASLGRRLGICPYYASRSAISPAEMVTLPYPLLLQKTAREALGISLKGQIVVIDEAHNVMDAIENIYTVEVSAAQLQRARDALLVYLRKFRNRLRGSNRVYVTQVVRVIDSMLLYVRQVDSTTATSGEIQASQLMAGKGVDQINLTKLVRYIGDSKLARKVEGYAAHVAPSANRPTGTSAGNGSDPDTLNLTSVQNFLAALVNPSKEGNFFWRKDSHGCVIRYMLLDPTEHFREIVEDARAVILAGGTMSPMDDYRQRLFPYLPAIKTFSCGHLIPSSSLLVRAIASDGTGPLEFSFNSRNSNTASRIGRALLRLAPLVQGGVVVFLPSYGMLEEVAAAWRNTSTMADLEKIKPVFLDSQTGSADNTFRDYSKAVASNRAGAMILSVIGGKLSEGINFADALGRCVVVVGLPFPNLQTAEWKARLKYIDDQAVARGEMSGKAGREHAENVCMKAVNQAVGRVIRHKDDWASILLIDSRYTQARIRGKLPGWIRTSFAEDSASDLRHVAEDLALFNKRRRSE